MLPKVRLDLCNHRARKGGFLAFEIALEEVRCKTLSPIESDAKDALKRIHPA